MRARERRTGIATSGDVSLEQLGLEHAERVAYVPSAERAVRRGLDAAGLGPDDVLADLGAGKGRVVLEAARRPLRRVIGVELSPKLSTIARANVERARPRLACRDVEIVTADVVEWEVPDDVTVAYLFNPFVGDTFRAVVERLIASVDRRPRRLRIVYLNPVEREALMATGRARLVARSRGLRPGREWARMATVEVYEVTSPPRGGAASSR